MKILKYDSWELDYVGWPCVMWMQNGPFCFFVSFIHFSYFYHVTPSATCDVHLITSFIFHTSHFAFGHLPQAPYIHWYVIFIFFFWNYFWYCFSVWGCTGKYSLMPWFQLKSLSSPPLPPPFLGMLSLVSFPLPSPTSHSRIFFSPSPLLTFGGGGQLSPWVFLPHLLLVAQSLISSLMLYPFFMLHDVTSQKTISVFLIISFLYLILDSQHDILLSVVVCFTH